MAKIGYMRISTEMQDHALQRAALERAGCDHIYEDTISGSTTARTGLDACMTALLPGDTLVVWKLDRLGRKVINLYNLVESLTSKGINFVSLTETLDTTTVAGRAMFGIMAVFAQMERETISMRVKAGLAVRKSNGKKLGPKFKFTDSEVEFVKELNSAGHTQSEICAKTGFSQPTISRILSRSATLNGNTIMPMPC